MFTLAQLAEEGKLAGLDHGLCLKAMILGRKEYYFAVLTVLQTESCLMGCCQVVQVPSSVVLISSND